VGCLNFLNDYERAQFSYANSWLRDFVGNLIKEGAATYPMDEDTDQIVMKPGEKRNFECTPQVVFNKALRNMKEWEVWKANGRRQDEEPSCYGERIVQIGD